MTQKRRQLLGENKIVSFWGFFIYSLRIIYSRTDADQSAWNDQRIFKFFSLSLFINLFIFMRKLTLNLPFIINTIVFSHQFYAINTAIQKEGKWDCKVRQSEGARKMKWQKEVAVLQNTKSSRLFFSSAFHFLPKLW